MTEDRSHEHEHKDPAPGAEHGETRVDRGADPSHGTGSTPEHVEDKDIEDKDAPDKDAGSR